MTSSMRAAVLKGARRIEIDSIPTPRMDAGQILVRPLTLGICGTDFHIFDGEANYHYDGQGRPIPLEVEPQILGHEIFARVEEVGPEVQDLRPGDRVVVDQGWNCHSQSRQLCEYCGTGDSHQCEFYVEQGITGLPGGMAEYLPVPAVNAVRVEGDLAGRVGALTEPTACVLHASARMEAIPGRYRFRGGEQPIRTVLICGAGTAGLLFLQYLRQVARFDGQILVCDPNAGKRALAERFGGSVLDPSAGGLVEQVLERTAGRGVEYLIEASGNGPLFRDIPGMIRKQATILLYGHGHNHVSLGVLNNVMFKEAWLVAAVGASGGFDGNGRPLVFQHALQLLQEKVIDVEPLISHVYTGLEGSLRAFTEDRFRPDYLKGVLTLAG